MDPLIRATQLAPIRTRLSEAYATRTASPREEQRSPHDTLRSEIEKQLRAELAPQLQKLYEDERQRAFTEGYAEGLAAARAAAAAELTAARTDLAAKMESALTAMEQAQREVASQFNASVGEVAFAAVCRFVGQQSTAQEFVLGLLEQACAHLRADTIATARMHPRDIQTLGELVVDDEIRIQSLGLKLVPDESVRLGGCLIEAASGRYDAGLESQLRRLHAVLTGKQES